MRQIFSAWGKGQLDRQRFSVLIYLMVCLLDGLKCSKSIVITVLLWRHSSVLRWFVQRLILRVLKFMWLFQVVNACLDDSESSRTAKSGSAALINTVFIPCKQSSLLKSPWTEWKLMTDTLYCYVCYWWRL